MYKIIERNNDSTREHLLEVGSYSFGRSLDNDIVINNKSVSRKHFIVNINELGIVTIKDNSSANGTFLNQNKIEANNDVVISEKDKFKIGDTNIYFSIEKIATVIDLNEKKEEIKNIDKENLKDEITESFVEPVNIFNKKSTNVDHVVRDLINQINPRDQIKYSELEHIQAKKIDFIREKAMYEISSLREESLLQSQEEALRVELLAKENAENILNEAHELANLALEESEETLKTLTKSIDQKVSEIEENNIAIIDQKTILNDLKKEIQQEEINQKQLRTLAKNLTDEMAEVESKIISEKENFKDIKNEHEVEIRKFAHTADSQKLEIKLELEKLSNDVECLISKKESTQKNCEELKNSQNIILEELNILKEQRVEFKNYALEEKLKLSSLEEKVAQISQEKEKLDLEFSTMNEQLKKNQEKAEGILSNAFRQEQEYKNKFSQLDSDFVEKSNQLEEEYQENILEKNNYLKMLEEEELKCIKEKYQKILKETEDKTKVALDLDIEIKEKREYFDLKVKEVEEGLEKKKKVHQEKLNVLKEIADKEIKQLKAEKIKAFDKLKSNELYEINLIKEAAKKDSHLIRERAGEVLVQAKEKASEQEALVKSKTDNFLEDIENRKKKALEETEIFKKNAREDMKNTEQAFLETYKKKEEEVSILMSKAKATAKSIVESAEINKSKLLESVQEKVKSDLELHEKKMKTKNEELETFYRDNKKQKIDELNKYKLTQMNKVKEEIKYEYDLSKEKESARINEIARNLTIIIEQKYSEKSLPDKVKHELSFHDNDIKKLVRASFYGDKELEGSKLKSILMINDDSSLQLKRFFRRVFVTYVTPILGLIVLYNSYGFIKDYLNNKSKVDSTSEVFVKRLKEERENKYNFNPKQDLIYKENYVDNVLYTKGYAELALSKSFQSQYVIKLNEYIINDLGLDETIVVSLNTIHTNLLKDILKSKDNIISGYEKSEIEKMRDLEASANKMQRKLLRTRTKYELFKKFEQDFYYSY